MRQRVRREAGLTLDDLDICAHLDLMSGWTPGRRHRESRWQTWSEYLHDYERSSTRNIRAVRHWGRNSSPKKHSACGMS